MDGFVSWSYLATYAGACFAVTLLTQFTKGLRFIYLLPTQLWSYILALIVLYPAMFFTNQLTFESSILTLFNAVVVSLSANGTYSLITRKKNNQLDSPEEPKG